MQHNLYSYANDAFIKNGGRRCLVYQRKKEIRVSGRTTEVVRVRYSTLEYINEMVEESGLSRQEIIDRAIRYAYDDLEWEEE